MNDEGPASWSLQQLQVERNLAQPNEAKRKAGEGEHNAAFDDDAPRNMKERVSKLRKNLLEGERYHCAKSQI